MRRRSLRLGLESVSCKALHVKPTNILCSNNGYYFLSATVSCVAANTNTLNTDTSCGIYRQNCLTTTSVANTYTYCALQNGAYKCFASCNPGYILYNGACVPLATDMNNCGTKGTV